MWPVKPTIFWKDAGNNAKICGLMRWSLFRLDGVIILLFRYVDDRITASYYSCRPSMQAIHAGTPCRRSVQATPAKPSIFWKKRWKHCQKMRLDALIIFPIEWRHNIVILMSKWSKYCKLEAREYLSGGWRNLDGGRRIFFDLSLGFLRFCHPAANDVVKSASHLLSVHSIGQSDPGLEIYQLDLDDFQNVPRHLITLEACSLRLATALMYIWVFVEVGRHKWSKKWKFWWTNDVSQIDRKSIWDDP